MHLKQLFRFLERPSHSRVSSAAMKYVNLGKSGLKVSRLCLGTMTFGAKNWNEWVLTEQESAGLIRRALDLGINFFDTADVYSQGVSEEILGKVLRESAARDQVIIATKVNGPMGPGPNDQGLSRKHVMDAVEASLRRLRTDYIDLYQIHRWDYTTPIEETLEVLHDLIRSGKVRYVGASSMFAWEFSRALYTSEKHGWTRFVSMQNHYNVIYREEEREMIPLCVHEEIAVLPWSPLARGFVAGNRSRSGGGETLRAKTDEYAHRLYYQEGDFQVAERVSEVARNRGVKPAQVALAWLLTRPAVTSPVIGVTKAEHLDEAVASLNLSLDAAEIQRLEECYKPHPVLGHP
jgi:aryl-alcohol dehydrogenase (NADP+)